MQDVAFYTVSDDRTFLGLVGLVNSLRRVGHDEPIYVLDCGLSRRQRVELGREAAVIPAADSAHPTLLKTTLPRRLPARVMVLLDADVIVLRRLDDLLRAGAAGQIVAFRNDQERFHLDWNMVATAPLRRQAYVNAGHLVVPAELGPRVFDRLVVIADHLGLGRATRSDGPPRTGYPSDPYFFTDQDVLNVILASEVDPADLLILDERAAAYPPFAGLELDDGGPGCRYRDGFEPYLLHHLMRKPWLATVRTNVYSRILTQLLVGPDHAVALPIDDVPVRLREGARGAAGRWVATLAALLRDHTRGKLGIRRRLHRRRLVKAAPPAECA